MPTKLTTDQLQEIGESFALHIKPDEWTNMKGKRELIEVSVPSEFINQFRENFPTLDSSIVEEYIAATILHLAIVGTAATAMLRFQAAKEKVIES